VYSKIKELPSSYKAYPEGTEISVRPLKHGEVVNYSERRDKIIDILEYFDKREVIKGINIWDISVGDWQFLELTIVAASYIAPTFSFTGPECKDCKKKMEEAKEKEKEKEVISVPGFPTIDRKKLPERFKVNFLPSELIFNSVEDKVKIPVTIDLDNGDTVELDFFRLRHYKEMLEKKLEGRDEEIAIAAGVNLEDDVTTQDAWVMETAYKSMDHGLADKVTLKCPSCNKEIEREVDWEILSLIPFHGDEKSVGERIHFGGALKSTNNDVAGDGLQTPSGTLRHTGSQENEEVKSSIRPLTEKTTPIGK